MLDKAPNYGKNVGIQPNSTHSHPPQTPMGEISKVSPYYVTNYFDPNIPPNKSIGSVVF